MDVTTIIPILFIIIWGIIILADIGAFSFTSYAVYLKIKDDINEISKDDWYPIIGILLLICIEICVLIISYTIILMGYIFICHYIERV